MLIRRLLGRVTCTDCGKDYKNALTLNAHKHYDCGAKKKFNCVHCDYSTKRMYDLEKHISRKHSSKPIKHEAQ
nr:unnamed protein product [Callosobruchus analis]